MSAKDVVTESVFTDMVSDNKDRLAMVCEGLDVSENALMERIRAGQLTYLELAKAVCETLRREIRRVC